QMAAANPNFQPARPVIFATVRPSEHDESVPLIGERVTSRIGDLFNVSYEILLQMLERFFAHTEETDAQLQTLAGATIGLMLGAIKPLGKLLTTLPVGPDYPDMHAGPSFELFYENDYLMPHREAAWALLEERVREAANFCGLIREIATPAVVEQLLPVGDALTGVADSLAAHFGDWGSSSRFMPGADAASTSPADVETGPLLVQAARLGRPVSRAAPPDAAPRPLAWVVAESGGAIVAAAQGEPKSAFAATRLLESVLRPLATAVTGRTLKLDLDGKRSGGKGRRAPADVQRVVLDDAVW